MVILGTARTLQNLASASGQRALPDDVRQDRCLSKWSVKDYQTPTGTEGKIAMATSGVGNDPLQGSFRVAKFLLERQKISSFSSEKMVTQRIVSGIQRVPAHASRVRMLVS